MELILLIDGKYGKQIKKRWRVSYEEVSINLYNEMLKYQQEIPQKQEDVQVD
jgi:hypothetical protein